MMREPAMANLLILVGTESGNAQMVAEALADHLRAAGREADIVADGDVAAADLAARELAIICSSTHGLGELPDCIIPLAEALERDQPDLSHLRYGVIALGDQTYKETFCAGGKKLDALFAARGAARIGERLEVDACTQPLPDEDAINWLKEWLTLV